MPKKESNEAITIMSVRNLRRSIKIGWTAGIDEYEVNFHDNPLKSFYDALDALKPHVCALCELHARDAEKISVTGITCRYSGEQTNALIVARKVIKKGKRVFNITTPLLPMYEDEANKSVDHMEEDQAKAVEAVISEATKYLGGERAQGQIQFEDPKGPDEEESNTAKFPELKEAGA